MKRTSAILVSAAVLILVAALLAAGHRQGRDPSWAGAAVDPTGIAIQAAPSSRYVLQGGDRELFLEVAFAAPSARPRRRPALNIALVIDRSGSMAGEKLAHARSAAEQLVSSLRPGDRIALVAYGSDVTVLVPSTPISPASRSQLLQAIHDISDQGGTFLSGGLESGRAQLQSHAREGYLNRLILISDGQANEGITDRERLAELARESLGEGVNVTTLGVGLDFDEELMTALAEHGGGHYYFVEGPSALEQIFAQELSTMVSVVGKSVALELALAPRVELVTLYGYEHQRSGDTVVVPLPDLFSGQQRKLVALLRVPAARAGQLALGELHLAYRDIDNQPHRLLAPAPRVTVTDDERLAAEGQDRAVLAKAEQARAASTIRSAMTAYQQGDVDRSRALLRSQLKQMQEANARLKSPALESLANDLDEQIAATAAAPASSAGRALVKRSKYRAYQLAK